MFLRIVEASAYLGLRIPLPEFPDLLQEFLHLYPGTREIERLGEQLARQDFPADDTAAFVKAVCKWGGYPGIGGRVLKDNAITTICSTLREALSSLAIGPSTAKALTQMNVLRGLGTPSFASKHLRFLRPDICPVLDSILCDALPYSFDPDGYSDFCDDCASLTKALASSGIPNPNRKAGIWFAADVEAALYQRVERNLKSHNL